MKGQQIDLREAALLLDCSVATARRHVAAGRLKNVQKCKDHNAPILLVRSEVLGLPRPPRLVGREDGGELSALRAHVAHLTGEVEWLRAMLEQATGPRAFPAGEG